MRFETFFIKKLKDYQQNLNIKAVFILTMGDINITYETLFELLRREKNREDLQKFDHSFFKDVVVYIKAKKENLEQQKTKQDLFAAEERKKAETQYANIRKILREIYEKREKKIVNMAIDRSRTSASIIDRSALLKEEREMYHCLVGVLDRFRRGILFKILEADIPGMEDIPQVLEDKNQEKAEVGADLEDNNTEEEKGKKRVKFIHAVPRFVGDDLKEYGPYEEADVSEIPIAVAEVLIDKGRAEEIE